MSISRYAVSIVTVSSCLLFLGSGTARAQRRTPASVQSSTSASGANNTTGTNSASAAIAQLQSIRTMLENANHGYQSHVTRAIHEISMAIHGLQGSTSGTTQHAAQSSQQKAGTTSTRQAQATNAAATGSNTTTNQNSLGQPQAASNQQLKTALGMLAQVSAQLGNAKPAVRTHLQRAIQQLKAAVANQ